MGFPFETLGLFMDGAGDGPWNMSLDEALLSEVAAPVLRVYGWSRSEVSFGCHMPFDDVRRSAGENDPLVRRWTGGGIVEHGSDWTYSLMVPSSSQESRWSPAVSYLRIHEALARTLRLCGFAADLHEPGPRTAGGRCFAMPVEHDVMAGAEKLAGAAQRRCRYGLLHQGSVLSVALPSDFGGKFADALGRRVDVMATVPERVLERAAALRAEKYGTEAWLRRR